MNAQDYKRKAAYPVWWQGICEHMDTEGQLETEDFQKIWHISWFLMMRFPIFYIAKEISNQKNGDLPRHFKLTVVPVAAPFPRSPPFCGSARIPSGEETTALSISVQWDSTLPALGVYSNQVISKDKEQRRYSHKNLDAVMHFVILLLEMCPTETPIQVFSKICRS